MKTFKLIIIIALVLSLILIVIQNTAPVYGRFLWMRIEMPAFMLLFFTSIAGFILGVMVTLYIGKRKV